MRLKILGNIWCFCSAVIQPSYLNLRRKTGEMLPWISYYQPVLLERFMADLINLFLLWKRWTAAVKDMQMVCWGWCCRAADSLSDRLLGHQHRFTGDWTSTAQVCREQTDKHSAAGASPCVFYLSPQRWGRPAPQLTAPLQLGRSEAGCGRGTANRSPKDEEGGIKNKLLWLRDEGTKII